MKVIRGNDYTIQHLGKQGFTLSIWIYTAQLSGNCSSVPSVSNAFGDGGKIHDSEDDNFDAGNGVVDQMIIPVQAV
jgi:allantoicase